MGRDVGPDFEFTENNIRKILDCIEKYSSFPQEISYLFLLAHISETATGLEREIEFKRILLDIVTNTLSSKRRSEGIIPNDLWPETREQIDITIKKDFSSIANMAVINDLSAWSALYHRFFAPVKFTTREIAHIVLPTSKYGTRQIDRNIQFAIKQLISILVVKETTAKKQHRNKYLNRYIPPATCKQIFGMQNDIASINKLLNDLNGPRGISIEGIGGIGKTSIARDVTLHIARQAMVQDILWVSIEQPFVGDELYKPLSNPTKPGADFVNQIIEMVGGKALIGHPLKEKCEYLKKVFHSNPFLIIIDNMESKHDAQQIIPILIEFTGTTRVLFTSRYKLTDYGWIKSFSVPELSFENSFTLVKNELQRTNAITENNMHLIYERVGGIPLALKLIAKQLTILPLKDCLEGLQRQHDQTIEETYTTIYKRSISLIDEQAIELLFAMLSVPTTGIDMSRLKESVSTIPNNHFNNALRQLSNYSLIEISGAFDAPIYQLHRMTVEFLQSEYFSDWKSDSDNNRTLS